MAKYISSYTGAQIDANLALAATAIQPGDYDPETKTSDMTQEVGKDTNGKLWTHDTGYTTELIYSGEATTEAVSQVKLYGNTNLFNYDKLYLHIYVPSNSGATDNSQVILRGCSQDGTVPGGDALKFLAQGPSDAKILEYRYNINICIEVEKIFDGSSYKFLVKVNHNGYSSQGYPKLSVSTVLAYTAGGDYYGFAISPNNATDYPTFPIGTKMTISGVKK